MGKRFPGKLRLTFVWDGRAKKFWGGRWVLRSDLPYFAQIAFSNCSKPSLTALEPLPTHTHTHTRTSHSSSQHDSGKKGDPGSLNLQTEFWSRFGSAPLLQGHTRLSSRSGRGCAPPAPAPTPAPTPLPAIPRDHSLHTSAASPESTGPRGWNR